MQRSLPWHVEPSARRSLWSTPLTSFAARKWLFCTRLAPPAFLAHADSFGLAALLGAPLVFPLTGQQAVGRYLRAVECCPRATVFASERRTQGYSWRERSGSRVSRRGASRRRCNSESSCG